MELEDFIFDLEEELGEITAIDEWNPGVYHIAAGRESQGYFAVLDTAPMAEKVRDYGKKMDGLLLFAQDDDTSGWRIVQYEISKYNISVRKKSIPEEMFRDMSLYAMTLHPEYFGTFPVPFHTPHGYTLRHRALANGIYWLETSMCKELLAVCYPVWDTELSSAARMLCESPVSLIAAIEGSATDYIFFSKEVSSIPLYELMETREDWDGTVICRPALMNAIWECLPRYALYVNGEKDPAFEAEIMALMPEPGLKALPKTGGDHMICMYPDAGTEFLLLR